VQAAAASGEAESISPALDARVRATLVHELRPPLSAITALAEVMREERLGPMGNARYLAYASDIHESARHALSVLVSIVEDSAGALDSAEPDETDLHDAVSKCLSMMRELARQATVRLEPDFIPGRPRLAVGRRSLVQILLNLISNSLKFTPAGGMITVSTRLEPDGGLVLSVIDTGEGMGREELARVEAAEPAPAGPRAAPGSGHGLPIVQALARAEGARLEITSAPAQGTRVSIIFPKERLLGT
jgi:signal transduction histidine kinase